MWKREELNNMKVLVTGVKGQLGYDIVKECEKRNIGAVGVDIDGVAVRTAVENAEINGVSDRFTAIEGDLTEKVSGKLNPITFEQNGKKYAY